MGRDPLGAKKESLLAIYDFHKSWEEGKDTPKEKSSLRCKVVHLAKGQVRSERRPVSLAHRHWSR